MLDREAIRRSVRTAGYDPETPLAVAVSMPSGTHAVVAQGETPGGQPFGAETVAYAASVGKQVTAACVALLAREGRLDPEGPIAEWLTELPEWSRRVLIRHLIHHTGALPDDAVWTLMQEEGETDWTSSGVYAALRKLPRLEREPGASYAYSNVGYICLALMVERIRGQSLAAVARELLFEPLQMRSSLFWSGPGHCPPGAAAAFSQPTPAALSVGDGGLWTSVHDLQRWNAALLVDSLGVSDTLHTPGRLDDGTPLDYAWGVRIVRVADGTVAHRHGGDWPGATSKVVRLPERDASFSALALDTSVDRMSALSCALEVLLA